MDITAVGGALAALKNAKDITGALIALRDHQAVQAKVIELQGAIMDAQERVFAVNEERLSLLERVRTLEAERDARSRWDAEKDRYELKEVSEGDAVVYALKAAEATKEAPHWLCPNCFARGQKSVLCVGARQGSIRPWVCTPCKTTMVVRTEYAPSRPG